MRSCAYVSNTSSSTGTWPFPVSLAVPINGEVPENEQPAGVAALT